MNHIRLLDCTLRDGGHIVDGRFGEIVIKQTIKRLIEAKINIIEFGFLWGRSTDKDTARFHTIEEAKRFLPKNCGNSRFSLMADDVDLSHLEPCDGTIEYIRLSCKPSKLESWAIPTARMLIRKAYLIYINPVCSSVYTDEEYINIIKKVNELHPYGFSIVDTWGTMRIHDLSHKYYLVESHLDKDIILGLHLHENLGLAYSLAQHFTKIASPTRQITVDASLFGMGRVPGNLCTEHIIDYMNSFYGASYDVEPVFDAIDDYIAPIKAKKPWGYSLAYALSAKYNIHRTYAEYLLDKKRLKTKDIQRILSLVDKSRQEKFDEEYIEKLYKSYLDVSMDSTPAIRILQEKLGQSERPVIVVAPGRSVNHKKKEILETVKNQNAIVISVNFVPDFIAPNYVFCANLKRKDSIMGNGGKYEIIITSNLINGSERYDYAIGYSDLVYFDGVYCEDSTLMLLSLLKKIGITELSVAGFDGIKQNGELYFYTSSGISTQKGNSLEIVRSILQKSLADVKLTFLTESNYER
ncbi:MAG: homocitrate synthase [Clostridium sp.]|jgi:4-hydroxy 2-oxovalerate aldolase|nr:homocitrate synthase [Clostridium sp.]